MNQQPQPATRPSRNRLAFLLLVLVAAAAFLYVHGPIQPQSGPAGVARPPREYRAPATAEPILAVAPSRMREAMLARYRLPPDRRFVQAAVFVRDLATRSAGPPPEVTFVDGSWAIRFYDRTVTTVPELADYDDYRRALSEVAAHFGHEPATDSTDANPLAAIGFTDPVRLLEELEASDRGEASLTERDIAARLVLVSMQTLDTIGLADRIAARAWAHLALAGPSESMPREETLVAELLGYTSAADRTAGALAPDDPIRLFLSADGSALAEAAEVNGAPPLTTLLHFRRLVHADVQTDWLDWAERKYAGRELSLPVYQASLESGSFSRKRHYPRVGPYLVIAHLVDREGSATWKKFSDDLDLYSGSEKSVATFAQVVGEAIDLRASDLVTRFESILTDVVADYPGPALDGETVRTFWEAYFYSSLHAQGKFQLKQLASIPGALEFADSLDGATSRTGKSLARWYRRMVESSNDQKGVPALKAELSTKSPYGLPLHEETFEHLSRYLRIGKEEVTDAVLRLVSQLDARPSHALELATTASSKLYDLRLSVELDEWVARVAGRAHPWTVFWLRVLDGDDAGLEEIARDRHQPTWIRLRAIKWIRELKPDEGDRAVELYRAVIADDPRHWQSSRDLSRLLADELGRHAEAREVSQAWLDIELPEQGLMPAVFTARVARTHAEEGDVDRAVEVVSTVVGSGQSWVLESAAYILEKAGRLDEAERFLEYNIERYPMSFALRLDYVRFLWRHGRNAEAAEAIKESPRPLRRQDWIFKIRDAFHETFAERADEDVLQAFEAMLESGHPGDHVVSVYWRFRENGRFELAWKMRMRALPRTFEKLHHHISDSYDLMAEWKGEEEALRWIRGEFPRLPDPTSVILYDEGQNDLLWTLFPNAGEDQKDAWLWLLRAAARVRFGDEDPDRGRILEKYFSAPRGDDVHLIARYLLGTGTAEEFWSRAQDVRTRTEAAYFESVRALCEGDPHAASDWLRVVMEIGRERSGERKWASSQLLRWQGKNRSLDALAPRCGPDRM